MLIEIRHRTTYDYSAPVRLDLQTMRLKPREDSRLRIVAFDLHVTPRPTHQSDGVDEEGNPMVWVRVDGDVHRFEIVTDSLVETVPRTITEADLAESARELPVRYAPDERFQLQRFFVPPWVDPGVNAYAHRIAEAAGGRALAFLEALARAVHKDHAYRARIEGPPWTPEETLAKRQGTCRDFTVLFMEACRAMGIATRFVSGYHIRERDNEGGELHAWAEAFLPGVGWWGFDPTIGKIVNDRHVALAAAPTPSGAAPVTGSFWGANVRSTLEAEVAVRPAPARRAIS